jgi:hypothetical protein
MHRVNPHPSIESLARRRQYSRAIDQLSSLPSAPSSKTLCTYKSFFRGLLSSRSRAISIPASQALDSLRTLHRISPDSDLTEQALSVFRLCRDLDRLHNFLSSQDLSVTRLTPTSVAFALETLALADILTGRDFQLGWSLIEPITCSEAVVGSFNECVAVCSLKLARRGRWGFARLSRILAASHGSSAGEASVAVAMEAIRALAVCPDLSSGDAVKLVFKMFIACHEATALKAGVVELYVRRGMLDHALAFAAEASALASSGGAVVAQDWWMPLVVAAANAGDPALTAFVWQHYEPRSARPPALIAAMADAAVKTQSGAMVVAALTEAVTCWRQPETMTLSVETVSEIRRLTELTTSVEVKDKLSRLLRVLPCQSA